jgi:hypothetical protein
MGGSADAATFFVGSLFFTWAGFLQYREAVDAGSDGPAGGLRKVFVLRPSQIAWLACGVQLIGTLFFNVSTADAMRQNLTTAGIDHHVWRPDSLGSVCLLVASALAWFEVSHGWSSWSPASLSWWITLLNLVGSVVFGASAVASHVVSATGELRSVALTNLGTFIGAVCFLGGAILSEPERTEVPPSA